MQIVCLDLEGVLVPEIWIAFAQRTGISDLRRTTRDEPDYDKLMRGRLDLLRRHRLGLPDIQKVIAEMGPEPGAKAFLASSAPRGAALRWSDEALQRLGAYDWPGNVRQLRNVVQRAILFRGEGVVVPAAALAFEDTRVTAGDTGADDTLYVRGLTLEDVEREVIRLSLRRHRGKRAAVVKELQIAKSTVMKRIAQWGLQHEGRTGNEPVEDDDEKDG